MAHPEQPLAGQASGPAAGRPSLWHNRDYMGWWTGNTVSFLGTSMSAIAYPLLVLYTTHSVAKAGTITAAYMIGTLATTLWGGVLADRVSRKAIMIIAPVIQAAALAVVALLVAHHHSPVPVLAACAFISGLAFGMAQGASTPALRRIVPKEQQAMATGQELGRDMAAEIIGAPLGGFLFSVTRWLPFAADAASFLFASAGAALIRRPLGPDAAAGPKTSMVADIRSGMSFVRRHRFLRFVVIWASLFNVVAQGFILLFIALVKYRGGSPTAVGFVSSVALIGGVIGAVVGPVLLRKIRARTVLYAAIWTFVGCFGLVAIAARPWQIGLILLVGMLGVAPLNIVLESYLVRLVPDSFSGRVSAVNRFGAQSLQWCGPLLAGILADQFGPPGGAIALMLMLVPLALALHLSRSLGVLEQPVELVAELSATPARQTVAS